MGVGRGLWRMGSWDLQDLYLLLTALNSCRKPIEGVLIFCYLPSHTAGSFSILSHLICGQGSWSPPTVLPRLPCRLFLLSCFSHGSRGRWWEGGKRELPGYLLPPDLRHHVPALALISLEMQFLWLRSVLGGSGFPQLLVLGHVATCRRGHWGPTQNPLAAGTPRSQLLGMVAVLSTIAPFWRQWSTGYRTPGPWGSTFYSLLGAAGEQQLTDKGYKQILFPQSESLYGLSSVKHFENSVYILNLSVLFVCLFVTCLARGPRLPDYMVHRSQKSIIFQVKVNILLPLFRNKTHFFCFIKFILFHWHDRKVGWLWDNTLKKMHQIRTLSSFFFDQNLL